MLVLRLLAVLAGAERVTDIARFGEKKLNLLRRLRPFAAGTPAHDHLGDILATLDAEAFQRCFATWVAALIGVKGAAKDAIPMVSAFAARQRLVLGQVKLADKANEILAIPKLLDMLAIEGAVETISFEKLRMRATGRQCAITQKIMDRKADYIHALKGNQGTLREDVDLFVAERKAGDFKHDRQPHGNRRWRSRPHRNPRDHGHPRHRLATKATRAARTEKRHHGRKRRPHRLARRK